MTQFSTRYELLRLGMGQEVAARRAFIATRGGLSWPTTIFCPPLSHLVLLNCWLKLAYYTTVIISGSLSACLLFQSNLAASINIVKIIAWARSCRGGSWSCRGRCRRTGCDVFSRQLCRECSRLVAAWTQTGDPWCFHKMFNSGWRALWLERRATIATWWQEIWNLPKSQCSRRRWRPEPWLQSLSRRRQKGSMCRLAWLTMSNTSLTSFLFLRRFSK